MTRIRLPAVAGAFYPAQAKPLHHRVQGFLNQAKTSGPSPKALIAPHAGYVYSGPVAASAYARLHPVRAIVKRVILVGPSHRIPFRGLAIPCADFFATPLGPIPVDQEALSAIEGLPFVHALDEAHRLEHSLEVQLPFLQTALDCFKIAPIVVGEAALEEVVEALDRLWGGSETVIIISSDLSHYCDYASAQKLDRATSQAIEALQPEALDEASACGRIPISGLLAAARQYRLKAATVDLRNSGDTAGPRDRVVGYGAYVFS